MSKKINYISHLNGFMQRRVYDLLSPNATTIYLVLFDTFNRSCWNFEWLKIPNRQLMYRTGITSPNTLATNRQLLKDLGYIECRLVKQGGKIYTAYRLKAMDSSGMFIDDCNENDTRNFLAASPDNSVDNSVGNVVDNIADRYYTEPQTVPEPVSESVSEPEPHSAPQAVSHPEPLYIDKKEKIKKVKKQENEGQLQLFCDAYEDYRKKPVSPKDRQKISAYLSEYGFDAMLEAMEIMVQKKAASIDYCGGILKNMHNDIQKQKEDAIEAGWQLA